MVNFYLFVTLFLISCVAKSILPLNEELIILLSFVIAVFFIASLIKEPFNEALNTRIAQNKHIYMVKLNKMIKACVSRKNVIYYFININVFIKKKIESNYNMIQNSNTNFLQTHLQFIFKILSKKLAEIIMNESNNLILNLITKNDKNVSSKMNFNNINKTQDIKESIVNYEMKKVIKNTNTIVDLDIIKSNTNDFVVKKLNNIVK